MKTPALLLLIASCVALDGTLRAEANTAPDVIVVVGAPGIDEYSGVFEEAADKWLAAVGETNLEPQVIGNDPTELPTPREQLQDAVSLAANKETDLWLVMIGHGTFDGREARFNLAGPDVSAAELADWLRPLQRRLIVFQCSSASAPFLNALSAPDRVVVTATKSGTEMNYSRFGSHVADALLDPEADIDQDGQNSVLEIFLSAARRTDRFYEEAGRLATEHALIDDNGDGLGTPASWYRGLELVQQSATPESFVADGRLANRIYLVPGEEERRLTDQQRLDRDRLETELDALRLEKSSLPEAEYFRRLESILLEIGRIYQEADPDKT